ncbi:MAG TPA: FmdB family zinc ribbon protein [Thermoleophilia bacterium]|nr:FmdB family zinc ribbon protein [Thermoleophilia bacterium]
MSPTTLFECAECGHRFELSRVVAQSNLTMNLCPRCGGHEIRQLGESRRESAGESGPGERTSGEDAA